MCVVLFCVLFLIVFLSVEVGLIYGFALRQYVKSHHSKNAYKKVKL